MDLEGAAAYARVKAAISADPALEARLVEDFGSTLAERFGIALPGPASLVRDGAGYVLTLGDRTYAVEAGGAAAPGELDDAELDLVSGGGGKGGDAAADPPPTPTPAPQPSLSDLVREAAGPTKGDTTARRPSRR